MKNKVKYIIGAVIAVAIVFSFGFIRKKKESRVNNRLLAMQNNPVLNSAYAIPLPEKRENTLEFKINKNTTDAEFLKIMEKLKEKDIDIMFNNVKRSKDGIITNIEIIVSKQDLTEDFSDANPNGIAPIIIKITDTNIYVGYEFNNQDDFFAFSNEDTSNQMAMMQKMMQRQMQMLQQLRGSSNNNDIFAQFFGNDPMMQNPDKMMQKMMQQMMQGDSFFSSGNHNSDPKVQSEIKMEKHYIVNGKEMTEEEYQKFDKSKIRSLQIYQTQVVSKRYGM